MPRPSGRIQTISDTALGVAYCRALETERPDAHFLDPFAHLLAGPQGAQIIRNLGGRQSTWSIVVRTCIIDDLVLRRMTTGIDTVLNLAAGLDTRPYRLPLPASLRWIEVDLPDILAYKRAKIGQVRPSCHLEWVPLDLQDLDQRDILFSRINETASRVLVITEGLLIYLTPAEVASLAQSLWVQPHFQEWISDLVSPLVLKIKQRQWHRQLAPEQIKLQFGLNHASPFFQTYGWQVHEFHSLWHQAHRLKREPWLGKLWRRLPCLEAGVVLLQSR